MNTTLPQARLRANPQMVEFAHPARLLRPKKDPKLEAPSARGACIRRACLERSAFRPNFRNANG